MDIQLSDELTVVTLTDLQWAIDKRYSEPDPIWVGLNVVSLLSSFSASQINKIGYRELMHKLYPSRIKNNWSGNWKDLVDLVSKITKISVNQVNYQLRGFTHQKAENLTAIRYRNFLGHEVFSCSTSLAKDEDGTFYLYDYHPITQELRPIPMQLLKEQFLEYESRYL